MGLVLRSVIFGPYLNTYHTILGVPKIPKNILLLSFIPGIMLNLSSKTQFAESVSEMGRNFEIMKV